VRATAMKNISERDAKVEVMSHSVHFILTIFNWLYIGLVKDSGPWALSQKISALL
jgi:hypothetical protein